ncbi:MAG: PAS-domain containing protein, partial [Xanthobacteraceae bacterium]
MGSAFRTRQPHEALPPEIYLPLVDSLYQEGRTLFVGTIFVTASVFVTYWKTGDILLFYCALAIILVACIRGALMRAYSRARANVTSAEIAKRWEYRYSTAASASVALLGIWCFLSFSRTHDAFAELVSFSMTGAYVAGIFGRNFANARFVAIQIICAWAPMTAVLLLYGTWFHWIFAGLLVPSFLGIKFIADRWRRTLLDAVITSHNMSLLAKRFDTALNNMPHGLCMFDAKRRVVVTNQKLKQQVGLAADFELKGLAVREVVEAIIKTGLLSETSAQSMVDHLEARLAHIDDSAFSLDLLNGRTLEFTVQPMENGGMVVL